MAKKKRGDAVNSEERLQRNIRSREYAEQVFLGVNEKIKSDGLSSARFWEELVAIAEATHKLKSKHCGMREHEAKLFEKTPAPCGAHEGTKVSDLPYEYLETHIPSVFNYRLRKYVRSAYFLEMVGLLEPVDA